jgi:glucose/arabinose dehydrogenase
MNRQTPSVLALLLLASAMPAAIPASAQVNAGNDAPTAKKPFVTTTVATFNMPWKLAFLPDRRMLVTEKPGPVWLVGTDGAKTQIAGTPPVFYQGQAGMLGVFVSPHFKTDQSIYLTYSEPGTGGSSLALARAKLVVAAGSARLDGLQVIWRQMPKGGGGQFGAVVAFAPDGRSLFLSVGERQRFTPAQDPNSELGKILHLTLDGKPAAGNPGAGKGAAVVPLFAPPKNTEAAKTVVPEMVTLAEPNLTPSEVWATGFRTPYGMTFSPSGKLWEVEHGPKGGDELNLIQPGKNYGWPLVSYGNNYDGVPIPKPDSRPDLVKPLIYWNPVIAPGGLTFYTGNLFPAWKGSAFIGGLASMTLNRVAFDARENPKPAERWDMGKRIRDVENGPDGALWLLEDEKDGRLLKLTPAS